jgi:hypothetical protein
MAKICCLQISECDVTSEKQSHNPMSFLSPLYKDTVSIEILLAPDYRVIIECEAVGEM